MKNIFGIILVAIAIAAASAGLWEKMLSLGDRQIETTPLTIEAKGWNLRGYMFEAPGNSDYICVFIAGSGKGGLACYPRGSE